MIEDTSITSYKTWAMGYLEYYLKDVMRPYPVDDDGHPNYNLNGRLDKGLTLTEALAVIVYSELKEKEGE